MKTKEIRKAIKALGPWYQRYEMDRSLYTTDKAISGEDVWPDIRSTMTEDLDGARILDIGCNAAYYSLMLALEGAEVTAIEPSKLYFKQARWTKYYFEQLNGRNLPVKLYKKSASELDYSGVGCFDYILVLSVIYHIGDEFGGAYSEGAMLEQKRLISEWCKITNRVVVRTRNDRLQNSIAHYNSIFLENGLYMLKKITGKRPILLYGRLEKKENNW